MTIQASIRNLGLFPIRREPVLVMSEAAIGFLQSDHSGVYLNRTPRRTTDPQSLCERPAPVLTVQPSRLTKLRRDFHRTVSLPEYYTIAGAGATLIPIF